MKKVFYYVLMLPAIVMLMSSCGGKKVTAKDLDGAWKIVSVTGEEIKMAETPFIEFDMNSHKVHGNAGCNIFNSTFTLSDSDPAVLTIAPAAATLMACPDMDTESKIFKALLDVASVKKGKTSETVVLADKDGKELLVLEEKTEK